MALIGFPDLHPLLGKPSTGGVKGCLLCHQPCVSLVAHACDARVSMHGARCARCASTQRSCTSESRELHMLHEDAHGADCLLQRQEPTPIRVLAQSLGIACRVARERKSGAR
eukprot:9332026-Alexandrium_andersonii.AAC.1